MLVIKRQMFIYGVHLPKILHTLLPINPLCVYEFVRALRKFRVLG